MSATVSELVCYPIKGCAGRSLRTARMTSRGIQHDRAFMIVDENRSFRSQRSDPVLALIRPNIDGDKITLEHPEFGMVSAHIDLRSDAEE